MFLWFGHQAICTVAFVKQLIEGNYLLCRDDGSRGFKEEEEEEQKELRRTKKNKKKKKNERNKKN